MTETQVQKRGMILTEVLVAIGGLMTALFVLSSIMSSAWSTVAASKNILIAQNLATEAVEGIKSLHDTNRMREPNDKSCWLRTNPALGCTDVAKEGHKYIVNEDEYGQSILAGDYAEMLDINDDGGIDGGDGSYLLKLVKVGESFKSYSHVGTDASIFYRGVKFNKVDDVSVTFEVLVQWMEGVKVKEIYEQVTISND